jgi:hypothetical protein
MSAGSPARLGSDRMIWGIEVEFDHASLLPSEAKP